MYTLDELNDLKTKTMIVYKITNLINNKVYIGQTVNTFNRRYCGGGVGVERLLTTQKSNKHLINAIEKYGTNSFKVEIIEQCKTVEELNDQENYYIDLYDSTNSEKGYNRLIGGENSQWSWERIIETYTPNRTILNNEIAAIKRLHKKTKIKYQTIINDIHKKPIFVRNRKTGEITRYESVLIYCYRNTIDKQNIKKLSDISFPPSPVDVLIHIRCQLNDERYTSVYKKPAIKGSDFFFVQKNNELQKEYRLQKREKMKLVRKKSKKKSTIGAKNRYVESGVCKTCGGKCKKIIGECSDCRRKTKENEAMNGKIKKICVVCNKEHYRNFDTCSTQCTQKRRNIRKKQAK